MSRYDNEQVMSDLAAMGGVERYRALLGEPTLRERLYPRRFVLAGAAAAVVIGISWFVVLQQPEPGTRLQTAVAEVREVALPDGSRVTLGAQSRLNYTFTPGERRVHLIGGEAFFSVSADPSRPFTVSSGDMSVKVIGTEFEIRKRRAEVTVAVIEGVVQVLQARSKFVSAVTGAAPEVRVLRRGETLVLPAVGAGWVSAQGDAGAIGAWREGRLVYDDVALRAVVEDANRYFSGGIEIADPALEDIRVTTSFRTSQVEGMIDTLRAALPLEVERKSGGGVVLKARRE